MSKDVRGWSRGVLGVTGGFSRFSVDHLGLYKRDATLETGPDHRSSLCDSLFFY